MNEAAAAAAAQFEVEVNPSMGAVTRPNLNGAPLLCEPHRAQRKQPLIRDSRGRGEQRVWLGGQQGSPSCFLTDALTNLAENEHALYPGFRCLLLLFFFLNARKDSHFNCHNSSFF